jgi:hypothetical protein
LERLLLERNPLSEILAKKTLEPILAQYKKDHPPQPPRPTPICRGQ